MHLLTTTPPTGWSTEGSQYALTEQITKYVREEWMSESINEPTKQGVFLLKAIEANILIRSFHHPSPWNLPLCLPKIHPSYLYSFPIAARINDHRRGDLKQRNVFSHSPGGEQAWNQGVGEPCAFWRLREIPVPHRSRLLVTLSLHSARCGCTPEFLPLSSCLYIFSSSISYRGFCHWI